MVSYHDILNNIWSEPINEYLHLTCVTLIHLNNYALVQSALAFGIFVHALMLGILTSRIFV